MSNIIINHPILTLSEDIAQICKPLEILGITYFSHVHIDKNENFTGIGNGPEFSENYFKNKYYNADIHLAKKLNLGKYIVWDSIERKGLSDKMYKDGLRFGVKHVFTIVGDDNENGRDYYHFASNTSSQSINQKYLTNIDLLEMFTLYFKNCITQSRKLSEAYKLKFSIDVNTADFAMENTNILINNEKHRVDFLNQIPDITDNTIIEKINDKKILNLPPQQLKCLTLLSQGKSAKEIAFQLNLSIRTVENYLHIIRQKMECRNQLELIYKISKK